jgi:thiol-disulfide isomerase/thioredoxin
MIARAATALLAGTVALLLAAGCDRDRPKAAVAASPRPADASARPSLAPIAAAAPAPAAAAPAAPAAPAGPAAATTDAAGGPALRVLTLPELKAEMARARGKPLVLHFWASWCYPCLVELPAMDRFAQKMRARGGEVLSISLDTEDMIENARRVLRGRGPNLTPIVARFDDPERFTAAFSPEWEGAIPAVFGFDRRGKLKKSLIGDVGGGDLDELGAAIARP